MKKIIILIFVCVMFTVAYSKIQFTMDYACFKADKSNSLVEIYFSVNKNSVSYKDLKGSFAIDLKISQDNKIVTSDKWTRIISLKTIKEAKSSAEIPLMSKFLLAPGIYSVEVSITDLTNNKVSKLKLSQSSRNFKVKKFSNKFMLSDLQLNTKMFKNTNKADIFTKYGVVCIPNASKIFGTTRSFINLFIEGYGLHKDGKYLTQWSIYNDNMKLIKSSKEKRKSAPGTTMVIFDRVPIHFLQTGSYILEYQFKDKKTDEIVTQSNNFFIYRNLKNKKEFKAKNIEDLFIAMNDTDLDKEFNQVYSILSSREKEIAKKLNKNGERNFLRDYWKRKEINFRGIRQIFKSYIKIANNRFSSSKVPGWRTPQGRILIKFGEPSNIERNPLSSSHISYEVWTYDDNNNIFVFADSHNIGTYRLIHTDVAGEIKNEDWESYVSKTKNRN